MVFCSSFKESRDDSIQVHFEDPFEVFEKVLEFLYSGQVEIPLSKIVPLRIAADQFQIEELSKVILDYLDKNLTVNNVFRVLEQSLRCTDDLILQRAAEFISINFLLVAEEFAQKSLDLPPEIFFGIIAHENLGKIKIPQLEDQSRDTSTSTRVPTILDEDERRDQPADVKSRNIIISRIVNRYLSHQRESIELVRMAVDALLCSDSLTSDDAMKYLEFAEEHDMHEQIKGCARVLAANFHVLISTAKNYILNMSPTSFKELLSCDDLFIKSENQVYDIASEYLYRHSRLSDEEKQNIMACVRFTFLSLNRLRDIKDKAMRDHTWFISKDTILDALWARIFRMECQTLEMVDDLQHMKPHLRPRTTRVFNYNNDFDTHGILYWLGTAYGTEKYINPVLRNLVSVTHTSKLESGKCHDLISHSPCSCNLLNQANSTVVIEFKTMSVMPTKYSLRHTNSRDAECLRNWKLQASTNNIDWNDLRSHVNDTSLNGKSSTHSWDIESRDEYYNLFRIIQTGNNSSSNTYLSMAGFELYGMVKKLEK